MIFEAMECPACKSPVVREVLYREDFPSILFPIELNKKDTVDTALLIAKECGVCSHIFLDKINSVFNKSIYRKYYYLYPYSNLDTMSLAYRRPFDEIFSRFCSESKNQSLLEIGCSTAEQLDIFIDRGFKCTGISPGSNEKDSPKIIDAFYEDSYFEHQFDCIVSRFNLEHVINLDLFVSKLRRDLKDGGRVFIQVPNAQAFVLSGLLNIFAHEHPHYFCLSSLRALFIRHGFEIEYLEGGDKTPSVILVAKKITVVFAMPKYMISIKKNIQSILDIIRSESRECRFIFYGAGLSLTGLLYLDGCISEYEELISVVDDNVILNGRYMPNTNIKIESSIEDANAHSSIVFLLLNSIYQARVIERLRLMKFKAIYGVAEDDVIKLA